MKIAQQKQELAGLPIGAEDEWVARGGSLPVQFEVAGESSSVLLKDLRARVVADENKKELGKRTFLG